MRRLQLICKYLYYGLSRLTNISRLWGYTSTIAKFEKKKTVDFKVMNWLVQDIREAAKSPESI